MFEPIRGFVHDEHGKPVANANIGFRLNTYTTFAFYESTRRNLARHPLPTARTGSDGGYALVPNPTMRASWRSEVIITVVAEGFAPHAEAIGSKSDDLTTYRGTNVVMQRLVSQDQIRVHVKNAPPGALLIARSRANSQPLVTTHALDPDGWAEWSLPLLSRSAIKNLSAHWLEPSQFPMGLHTPPQFLGLGNPVVPPIRPDTGAAMIDRGLTLLAPGFSTRTAIPLPMATGTTLEIPLKRTWSARNVLVQAPDNVSNLSCIWLGDGRTPIKATVHRDAFLSDGLCKPIAAWADGAWAEWVVDDFVRLASMPKAAQLPPGEQPPWVLDVRDQDGTPIAGVVVEFFEVQTAFAGVMPRSDAVKMHPHATISAVAQDTLHTSPTGQIILGPRRQEPVLIRVSARGYETRVTLDPHRLAAENRPLKLPAQERTTFEIQVVAPNDKPVVNASANWSDSSHPLTLEPELLQTDARGFLRGTLPAGHHRVAIHHPQFTDSLHCIWTLETAPENNQIFEPLELRFREPAKVERATHVKLDLDAPRWTSRIVLPAKSRLQWIRWTPGVGPTIATGKYGSTWPQAVALWGWGPQPEVWIALKEDMAWIDLAKLPQSVDPLNLATDVCHLRVPLRYSLSRNQTFPICIKPESFATLRDPMNSPQSVPANIKDGELRIMMLPGSKHRFSVRGSNGDRQTLELQAPMTPGEHRVQGDWTKTQSTVRDQ